MKYDPEMLVSIAKEIGKEDSIDFGYLEFDEDTAYNVVALGILEKYMKEPEEDRVTILLATCIHLLVENMALNLRLMKAVKS